MISKRRHAAKVERRVYRRSGEQAAQLERLAGLDPDKISVGKVPAGNPTPLAIPQR